MINGLMQRLKQENLCLGAWQSTPSALIAEAMASCGFHWLAVDMEHGTMSASEAEDIARAVERHGCAAVARIPSADPYLARRLLDGGFEGIIVPVSESADGFSEFAEHCLYPPKGRRGVGLSRCNLWGYNFEDYSESFIPVLIPQVETKKGVEASAALAALDCVAALFLGPYDLSADLGTPGNFETPEFAAALHQVKQSCQSQGKAVGFHQVSPDYAALQQRINEGYRLLAYGTEIIAMRDAFKEIKSLG